MSGREGMVQVRASFSVHPGIQPVNREASSAASDERAEAAERLAAKHGVAVFEAPPFDVDAETREALAAWDAGLPLRFPGSAVDFAADIPLMVGHLPVPLASLDVAAKGSDFTLTGWVPEKFTELLSSYPHCSPGLQIRRARIVEIAPGSAVVDVQDAMLIELSAAQSPRLEGTSFAVGPRAGVRYWPDPSWETAERFTQSHPGMLTLAFPSTIEVY
jgi:hypothetical protein